MDCKLYLQRREQRYTECTANVHCALSFMFSFWDGTFPVTTSASEAIHEKHGWNVHRCWNREIHPTALIASIVFLRALSMRRVCFYINAFLSGPQRLVIRNSKSWTYRILFIFCPCFDSSFEYQRPGIQRRPSGGVAQGCCGVLCCNPNRKWPHQIPAIIAAVS